MILRLTRRSLWALLWSVLLAQVGTCLWDAYFTPERRINENEDMCLPGNFTNRAIYCGSRLIEAVNYVGLYNDSKTFVDSPLKANPDVVLGEFNKRFGKLNYSDINRDDLQSFVDEYFQPPTSELVTCEPEDWQENPPAIMKIQDPDLRNWALKLNHLWKDLCREIDPNIKYELDKHTIIWVDNKFIIPGGRFREFYYWDSFWIVKGLLVSGMRETAKGMARNLGSMVTRFGHIPNGGRIYYKRSQPPMLAPIVYAIYDDTDDQRFLEEMLPILEKEFEFWQNNRKFKITSPAGNEREVYFYRTGTVAPRPESMRADLLASNGMAEKDQKQFFLSVASAAESGWDFGSRWFADRKTLQTIETAKIAPVDLNSYMCYNMDILHYLYEAVGDREQAKKYEQMHANFRYVHDEVFYNKTAGSWYDYNTRTSQHTLHNYPSIATPLFTDCYDRLDDDKPRRLFQLLLDTGFFNYSGGVPTSLYNTSQQWDFPNGWAPLQHIIIEGLRKSADPSMQDKAYEIAVKWIHGNYKVYNKTGHMYEKYNVDGDVPEPGGGGEYNVQTGFGWSNGIILDLLSTYYDRISAPVLGNPDTTTTQAPNPTTHGLAVRDADASAIILPCLALLNLLFTLL